MSEEPSSEEKKPNPILNKLDKEKEASVASAPVEAAASNPPAEPPPPAPEAVVAPSAPVESLSPQDSPQELVTDAMRRLDDILKKIKEKKADPAP